MQIYCMVVVTGQSHIELSVNSLERFGHFFEMNHFVYKRNKIYFLKK